MTNQAISSSAEQLPTLPPRSAKAALIAFDQMEPSQLAMGHVTPLLRSPDAEVRRAALWVFARHADWGAGVREYLTSRLRTDTWDAGEADLLAEMLQNFAADAAVQTVIAAALNTGVPPSAVVPQQVDPFLVASTGAWTQSSAAAAVSPTSGSTAAPTR